MINQTGNRVHRHRPCYIVLDVNISKELIANRGSNSKHTIKISFVFSNPRIRQRGKSIIVVCKMPHVQRMSVSRTHFAGNLIRLITVICPSFLVTKNFIVLCITLCIDFFVLNGLFANIGEHRPIKIKLIFARPQTGKPLLVSVIVPGNHQAKNITMFSERLGKVGMGICSQRLTDNGTLRSTSGFSTGLLNDLVYIDGNTITAEIFGTLKASIRRNNAEERADNLSITRTTTSKLFIVLLNLESKTKLVNRSTNTTGC